MTLEIAVKRRIAAALPSAYIVIRFVARDRKKIDALTCYAFLVSEFCDLVVKAHIHVGQIYLFAEKIVIIYHGLGEKQISHRLLYIIFDAEIFSFCDLCDDIEDLLVCGEFSYHGKRFFPVCRKRSLYLSKSPFVASEDQTVEFFDDLIRYRILSFLNFLDKVATLHSLQNVSATERLHRNSCNILRHYAVVDARLVLFPVESEDPHFSHLVPSESFSVFFFELIYHILINRLMRIVLPAFSERFSQRYDPDGQIVVRIYVQEP